MQKERDPRFKTVGYAIKNGDIRTFDDIFVYAIKTNVAKHLKGGVAHLNEIIHNPLRVKIEELAKLADLFEVDLCEMIDIVVPRAREMPAEKAEHIQAGKRRSL